MKFEHGYALIVGVGQSAYSAWSLPVTVKDAKVLVSVLTDPSLCAYPASDDHMRLLVDEGATRANIRHGLEWLAQCAKADREATVVVYFSGHGWTASKSGGYYLIPHDVNPFDIPASALSRVEFTGLLRGIDARRFLVFLDTCHAGGMATAKDDAALSLPQPFIQAGFPKDLARDLAQGQGRAVFASSRGDERSCVRRDRSMSIYTYHLVEALQGAGNRSGDTVVRLSNLVTHLSLTVPESARELGGARQTPFYDWSTEDFAVALVRGNVTPDDIADDALDDPEILRLSQSLVMRESDHANRVFPGDRLARVALVLTDGTRVQGDWSGPRWDHQSPPTGDELRAKYHALADPVLGPARAAAVESALAGLAGADLSSLSDLLLQPIS